ncbi:MAG: TIGR01777 family protein [Deltaproteobacteria bacterium]|nr:TIGR01777 family protein [Deltaproteobacteria bacterium]
MKPKVFQKSTIVDVPVSSVFNWHERPGALNRMAPPWDPLIVISSDESILPGAQSLLKMKLGPFSYKWLAEHQNYIINQQFQDQQVKGPLAYWCHTHLFDEVNDSQSRLTDKIEYRLPGFGMGDFIMGNNIKEKLNRIFRYRHRVLKRDLMLHQQFSDQKPLKILISGGGGIIGSALIPFLTTGGHQVIRLVRNQAQANKKQIFWDPIKGEIDKANIGDIDVVIHLAGENIGEGRWTPLKKKRILDSRINSTKLLLDFMKELPSKPRVFLSASAIGYYGNRQDQFLTEEDHSGNDFISEVCHLWETEAMKAENISIRTCLLRIGVVLTPLGGALARLHGMFKIGLGAKLGQGDQYLSWIGMDDVLSSIYHLIYHEDINGPVNLVSPNPVTNKEFTNILAGILGTKANKSIPEWLIQKTFGQLGDEIVLSSTKVIPQILSSHQYHFIHDNLKDYLTEQLGLA